MEISLRKNQANPHILSLRISPGASVHPGDLGNSSSHHRLQLPLVSKDMGNVCIITGQLMVKTINGTFNGNQRKINCVETLQFNGSFLD